MATKVSSLTVGSWYPTGYYGHNRSRARSDFLNEYRQLAKPQPPQKFILRSSQPASAHSFSRHDNRHSFLCDASICTQGRGKKKHPERSGTFDPNFIAWWPDYTKSNGERPLTSTYRKDFRREEPIPQLLVKRPKTSFDHLLTTTYRTVHGSDSPNHDFIDAMSNEALMLSLQNRQRQAKLKKSDYRETVASCMSWYRPRVEAPKGFADEDHIDMRPTQQVEMNINNTLKAPSYTTTDSCCDVATSGAAVEPILATCE